MPDPPKYCHRCYWLLEKDSACALCHDGMLDPHSFWFYDLCDLAKCQDDITSFNRFLRSGGVLTDGRFVSSDMPAPPHCGVLLDPRCEHLPEHVCYDMLQTSIESFIRNNYASSCHEYTHWSTNYPLPLGELRKARSLRRSNPPTWGNWRNFSKLPKFPTSGPGDAALVIVERRGPDGRVPRGENNPNEFPDWAIGYRDLIEVETNPPTGLPGRWQVVLFGIADPAVDADDREALRVLAREWHQREQPSIVRHQHALRRLSRSLGIEEPLLERGLREVGQLLVSGESDAIRLALQELEFVRHTDGNGDVRPILDYPLPTIFGPPMLQVIAEGVPAREAEEQEAGRLVRWYRRLLQGKAPAAVGRPRGSSTYKDRNEFVVAVREAVLALRNQRRSITQRTVAEALNCDERQLREWTKQHEFDGWHDLRKAVDPQ